MSRRVSVSGSGIGSVQTANIADGAVTTAKIADGAVTLIKINAAVQSAAQGTESLRQIGTSTPQPIGTAAAGNAVTASASNHVHAITDGTLAESKFDADTIGRLDPLSTFPSYGTVNGLFQGIGCTDFLFNSSGTAPFAIATSGTGSNVINIGTTATGTRLGVVAVSTGTDTTGRAGVGTTGTSLRAGVGRYRWRADIRVPTASDGTDTFTLYAGFTDLFTGIGTCGAYVTYTHGTNSGNLVFTTRSASTSTSTNLAMSPVSVTAWTAVEIQIDQDLGHAYCYVNGALVATHTTNIPISTELFGALTNIVKSAGTTARTCDLDLMGFRVTRAAAI
jgi:hypothetical protein